VAQDTPYVTLGGDVVAALLRRSADIHTVVGLLAEAGVASITLSALDEMNEIAERVLGLE
jgi:hypothetical protein